MGGSWCGSSLDEDVVCRRATLRVVSMEQLAVGARTESRGWLTPAPTRQQFCAFRLRLIASLYSADGWLERPHLPKWGGGGGGTIPRILWK